jgi:hypothetical protein
MSNQNADNQEIDLGKVFSNINEGVQGIFFNAIKFVLKNKLLLALLFVLGAALGFFIDSRPTYKHELVLLPNYGVVDYLYTKNDQFNSLKTVDKNNVLEKKYQLKKRKKIGNFKLEPINDIYGFIRYDEKSFEFLKLMAEDGSIKKIIDEEVTSKNYSKHRLLFSSSEIITEKEIVKPYLDFLNDDVFLNKIRVQSQENLENKIRQNDTIIKQIDDVLKKYGTGQTVSGSLSISGENVPLDQLIELKDKYIYENSQSKISKLSDHVLVKDYSVILNIKDTKGLNGKMKFVFPILFVLLFAIVSFSKNFYLKNKAKLSA